jgi:hypothetical protein
MLSGDMEAGYTRFCKELNLTILPKNEVRHFKIKKPVFGLAHDESGGCFTADIAVIEDTTVQEDKYVELMRAAATVCDFDSPNGKGSQGGTLSLDSRFQLWADAENR